MAPWQHGTDEHTGARATAGLNTSLNDAGWSHFLSLLAFTPACAGTRVEAITPASSSQDCSGCGTRIDKPLSVRTHVCTTCGLVVDRDENAATNIVWRGQRLRAVAGLPAALHRAPVGL